MAEKYYSWSGYNYVMGNPVGMVDPDGRRVEDIVFVNVQGKEVKRIKDENRNYIVIVNSEMIKEIKKTKTLKKLVVYDMKSVDALFQRSMTSIESENNVKDINGKTLRKKVYKEHGNVGVTLNGVVRVSDNEDSVGFPSTVTIGGQGILDVHSHPNEQIGPFKYRTATGRWIIVNPYNDRGPSSTDREHVRAKPPFFDIMVDDKKYYFYNENTVISVPKSIFHE